MNLTRSAAFKFMAEDTSVPLFLNFITEKDVLPARHYNNVIYQFVCHCDSQYVGRTSQRLQDVSRPIRNHHFSRCRSYRFRACKTDRPFQIIAHDSAIGQHLLENPSCASQYSDAKFSVLVRGRTSFHLSPFEGTFIKSFQPNLCRDKEFLYSLKFIH